MLDIKAARQTMVHCWKPKKQERI